MANLVNFGILPLTFTDKNDYEGIAMGDMLDLDVKELSDQLELKNQTKGSTIKVTLNLSTLEKAGQGGGKLAQSS